MNTATPPKPTLRTPHGLRPYGRLGLRTAASRTVPTSQAFVSGSERARAGVDGGACRQTPAGGTVSAMSSDGPRGWLGRWFDRRWYRYLRERYPNGVAVAIVFLIVVLGIGGYQLAAAAGGDERTHSETYVAVATTVQKPIRVMKHGRVVIKHVPVVKRVYMKARTVMETQTISEAGKTRVVARRVVRYRPVLRRQVVFVHGKPVTTLRVVTDTRMLTDTQLLTVTAAITRERTSTVVNEHTSTVLRDQTVNQTISRTETAPIQTVTAPAVTVTVKSPAETVVVTSTEVVTATTRKGPAETVTVTVTEPAPTTTG
jgi:hypothetical protein